MDIYQSLLIFPLAYLDPGSGVLLVQLIIGAIVGMLVFFRGWLSVILGFFGISSQKDEDEDIEEIHMDEQTN